MATKKVVPTICDIDTFNSNLQGVTAEQIGTIIIKEFQKLGKTSSAIARALARKKIKGEVGDTSSCALAEYAKVVGVNTFGIPLRVDVDHRSLTVQIPTPVVFGTNVVGSNRKHRKKEFKLPIIMQTHKVYDDYKDKFKTESINAFDKFITEFDNEKYKQLIKK